MYLLRFFKESLLLQRILQYIQMKEIKRADERTRNKEEESMKKYQDCDWKAMQESGMMKKLRRCSLGPSDKCLAVNICSC